MVETDVTAGQRHASEFQGRSGHPPCSRMIEDVTIEDVTEEFWIGFCRTTESVEHPHRPYVNVAGEKYSRCFECGKFLEKQRLGPSGSSPWSRRALRMSFTENETVSSKRWCRSGTFRSAQAVLQPTVAMEASPPAPPPEPPTVVSDADQPQATEAPPNSTVEKRFVYDVFNYQHPVHDLYQHPEATNNPPESMPTPKAMPASLVARELARQDRDRSFLVARGLAALEANSHPPASNVPADVQARILAQLDRDRARLAYASPKAGSISPGRCGTCQTCTDSNCAQPPSRPPSSEKSCATDATEWMHSAVAGRGWSSRSN